MRALITGISGQDGSYLAEKLIKLGYEVHGIVRPNKLKNSSKYLKNLNGVIEKIFVYGCSLNNYSEIESIIDKVKPDECYHLASSSHVDYGFQDGSDVLSANFIASKLLFEALKKKSPDCKIYFAGSSEMFGECDDSPQNEKHHFNPRSIYGLSKVSSYHLAKFIRKQEGIFISTGFLYNHESPRRGVNFVTRKISSSVAKIYLGLEFSITLGNLNALRDWGYAPDYVDAMYKMLQQKEPDDFVIATGILHSVEEFLIKSFEVVGLNYSNYLEIDN
jgi:GDPmannose 4,6-dehydratase